MSVKCNHISMKFMDREHRVMME